MLKRFFNGMVFGSGFTIAFVLVGAVAMNYVLPRLVTSAITETRQPEFNNPKEVEIAQPGSTSSPETKDFSFFNSVGRMEIPSGGGILSMSPVSTAKGSKKPSTYQLWLTESKLWQIRTNEEKVEIEELPYPKNASISNLDQMMTEKLGVASRQSSMTVSPETIAMLESTGRSARDKTLNGELKISVERVVFVSPNPYEP